ncbi:MAG: hypothetical protein ACI853_002250, partial [Paracoccaceae bacterium]
MTPTTTKVSLLSDTNLENPNMSVRFLSSVAALA